MKEKLLALLIAKFVGVDKAILERIAEKKSNGITDEDQLQTIADGVTVGTIVQSEADRRATEASQTASKKAVSEYEKKHNLKDGKTVKKEDKTPEIDDSDQPDWFKTYRKEQEQKQEELQRKIDSFEGEKNASVLNQKLVDKLKAEGITEKDIKVFNLTAGVTIESEEDVESVATSIKEKFTESKQELINSGNYTEKPENSNTGGSEKSVEDYQKLMDGDGSAEDAGKVDLGVDVNN